MNVAQAKVEVGTQVDLAHLGFVPLVDRQRLVRQVGLQNSAAAAGGSSAV